VAFPKDKISTYLENPDNTREHAFWIPSAKRQVEEKNITSTLRVLTSKKRLWVVFGGALVEAISFSLLFYSLLLSFLFIFYQEQLNHFSS